MKFQLQASMATAALLSFNTMVDANPVDHPNFIVMQPDDMPFLEAWGGAPHFDASDPDLQVTVPVLDLLPNLQRLRTQGVQMMEAYAASPMCGTSRYSTMTGRYPSRSSYSRDSNSRREIPLVTIPNTKVAFRL